MNFAQTGRLTVAQPLHAFIECEALPGTDISAAAFWSGLADLVRDFGERNRQLLEVRDALQLRINAYHRDRVGQPLDFSDYESFLCEIGYLLPRIDDFTIRTTNVDDEIAHIAGPQLVVPLSNARYALNAANARWGSFYDALYGTDAIPDDNGGTRAGPYNSVRGERVVARGRAVLDMAAPLAQGSHRDALAYSVEDGALVVRLRNGVCTGLARPIQFVGYCGQSTAPSVLLLRNHNLHIAINIDRASLVGRGDPAGITDIVLEAAVTTIMDLEDSVAAVDAEDKVAIYRNWLGLVKGTLRASFEKGGKTVNRRAASLALRFRNLFLGADAPAPRAQYDQHQPPVGHFFLRYSLRRRPLALGRLRRRARGSMLTSPGSNQRLKRKSASGKTQIGAHSGPQPVRSRLTRLFMQLRT
jgi:malate synthase